MTITPVIILIWKIFIVLKLGQFVYNIGVDRPTWGSILTQAFNLVILISLILFGFEILEAIPTWEEFSEFGKYVIMIFIWLIEFGLTGFFNELIQKKKS